MSKHRSVSQHNQEEWRDIPGWDELYQVSNLGRVRSLDRVVNYSDGRVRHFKGKILKSRYIPESKYRLPYERVDLVSQGKKETTYVHRLVMLAFVGPCPEGMEIDHTDNNPKNNQLVNLRYVTPKENNAKKVLFGTSMADKVANGTHPQSDTTHCPRGHKLEAPNLVPNRKGRSCLACQRAHSYTWYHPELKSSFQDLADNYHRKIMESHDG